MSVREDGTKRCPRCARFLAVELFGRRRCTPDGLAVYCRTCTNAMSREAYWRKRAERYVL